MIVVDTGVLYSAADEDDRHHRASARILEEHPPAELLVPTPVVVECSWLIESRLGSAAEAGFLRSVTSGEPGVGKTRIAEELTIRCIREGFTTFTGNCYEAAGAAPYIPIVEIYGEALAAAPSPAAFRDFLGDEAAQIAKLVPRLRQLCPDIPPPIDLPADQERRYLFNSVWEVLARTANARPTLLVLDDIHWADEPTMLLIQHCAERVVQVPLLIVGLYRDSELDAGRPLSRTFSELTRRRLAVRLSLHRLPVSAIAEMLAALAGQDATGCLTGRPCGTSACTASRTSGRPNGCGSCATPTRATTSLRCATSAAAARTHASAKPFEASNLAGPPGERRDDSR